MIQKMAVLGAGVMGSEIAQAAAAAGVEVVLLDSDPAALERGIAHVGGICARRVERGRMSAEEADAVVARVRPTGDDADLADCDLAIEAVPEIMDIKRQVFRRLDGALPAAALLASNTSGLSITEMAAETGRPSKVVGLHFFNPASVMKLVEVIRGETTSEETMVAAEEFARAAGKIPVRVKECPGFLVNRILVRALSEAYRHAAVIGADMAAADRAAVENGPAPMGPFALGDLIGLDTLGHIQRDLVAAYGPRFDDGGEVRKRVDAGRLGKKSGSGFYDGDPLEAAADGPGREVAYTYFAGAFDEARLCVDDGIAAAADVDLAMQHGCGWKIGPLEWERTNTSVSADATKGSAE